MWSLSLWSKVVVKKEKEEGERKTDRKIENESVKDNERERERDMRM